MPCAPCPRLRPTQACWAEAFCIWSNVHSQEDTDDGPNELSTDTKLDLCGLACVQHADGIAAALGLWVGPQASVGCVKYLYNVRSWIIRSCSRYTVQRSRPDVGEVFMFSAHSLLNDALNYSP